MKPLAPPVTSTLAPGQKPPPHADAIAMSGTAIALLLTQLPQFEGVILGKSRT
jgi:hypothetical protein